MKTPNELFDEGFVPVRYMPIKVWDNLNAEERAALIEEHIAPIINDKGIELEILETERDVIFFVKSTEKSSKVVVEVAEIGTKKELPKGKRHFSSCPE